MPRKHKHESRGENAETTAKEPPITHGEVTEENPSGIEAVSEEHATQLGQSRDTGGPGAAGATVAGPVAHVATEGGSKPLPLPVNQQEPAGEEQEEEKKDEE